MANTYTDENGRTWYNYIDTDGICTSFSALQTGKTPCEAKDTDKTADEIAKIKSNSGVWRNPVNIMNAINKNLEQKDNPPPAVTPFKMPVWGWATIGVVGTGIIVTIIILAVKAAKK